MVAVVLGTAIAAGGGSARAAVEPNPKAINDISKYCQTCWRNARLPADRWQDCTQEVFTRLLERVEPTRWARTWFATTGRRWRRRPARCLARGSGGSWS